MNRKKFLQTGATTVAATTIVNAPARAAAPKFQLKYAPHFGMFRNSAPGGVMEELKFIADQGFTALEDNGMKGRSVAEQEAIAKEMTRLGLTMGVFVANTGFGHDGYAKGEKARQEQFLKEITESVEVAKRVNAKWCTIVLGERNARLEWDYQNANVIELLKRGAAICEKSGLVMVMEPLNPWRDHPNMFLAKVPHAYMLCKAVGSPSCKILFDMYHQQITEGNIIPNIDLAWSETAYFQIGDNPGRREPTTGEMNYQNIFRHIAKKGFTGVLGMEHGNSKGGKEGEQAVIAAYRHCDQF
jgi:hydroxypyruvate isomerase